MEPISTLLGGVGTFASLYAIYDSWKKEPDQQEARARIDFLEWLNLSEYKNIAQDLELIIAQNQHNEDLIRQGSKLARENINLLHEELKKISDCLQKIEDAKLQSPEIEVALDVNLSFCAEAEDFRPVAALKYGFTPRLKNAGKKKISEFRFYTKVISSIQPSYSRGDASFFNLDGSVNYETPKTQYEHSLLFNDEVTDLTINFEINEMNLVDAFEIELLVIFVWDGGYLEKKFNIRDFLFYKKQKLTQEVLKEALVELKEEWTEAICLGKTLECKKALLPE